MTYTHLTTDELVMIESYYHKNVPITKIAVYLNRTRTPIYNVVNFFKEGHSALEYYQKYKEKGAQGWTPDVIIGRAKEPAECSVRTLYRQFKEKIFDETTLPMKGKRKPNSHKERRGKQAFKRNIAEREKDYPQFKQEFGHIEGDTIVGVHHKSAIITLVEHLSKDVVQSPRLSTFISQILEHLHNAF